MSERLRQWRGRADRARGAAARTITAPPLRASLAVALLAAHLAGCFHYVPVAASALPSGADVAVGISDRGRVALADSVGPGVRRITGRLTARTDSSLVLAVNSIQYLDLSNPVKWTGERLNLPREVTSEIQVRRLSGPRTGILAAVLTAAAVVVARIAITGFGGDSLSDRVGDGDKGHQ